jgi:hypothetical protein
MDATVAAILARPLFAPTRRPSAAAASAAPGLPRLTGVIVTPLKRAVIFAAPDGNGRPTVVTEGERIAGFLVQSISAGEVTLAGPTGTHTLHVSYDPNLPPPTAQIAITKPPVIRRRWRKSGHDKTA